MKLEHEDDAAWNIQSHTINNYLKSCEDFVNDDEKFKVFKMDKGYTPVLEHISYEESILFISEMKNTDSISNELIQRFKENDLHGTPQICEYDLFGKMSPSTIRYIKNTLDIFDFFHSSRKNIKNIVEIGGGYGGLCKTMNVLFDFDNYTLVDLPVVNKLSKKYISKFENLEENVSHVSFDQIEIIENADLVISNYAFSECSYEIQKKYYDKIISNSNFYYMVYNNMTQGNMNSDSFFDFSSNDFDIFVEQELRQTHTNYIFYGTKR